MAGVQATGSRPLSEDVDGNKSAAGQGTSALHMDSDAALHLTATDVRADGPITQDAPVVDSAADQGTPAKTTASSADQSESVMERPSTYQDVQLESSAASHAPLAR